jgi:hypothetical protein
MIPPGGLRALPAKAWPVDSEGNVYAAEGPISLADAGGGLTKNARR